MPAARFSQKEIKFSLTRGIEIPLPAGFPPAFDTKSGALAGQAPAGRLGLPKKPGKEEGRLKFSRPSWCLLFRQGQGHGKRGALAHLALQPDGAAVELDDVLDNGHIFSAGLRFVYPLYKPCSYSLPGSMLP